MPDESPTVNHAHVLFLSRAHRRYLNVLPTAQPGGDEFVLLKSVVLQGPAVSVLRAALDLQAPRTGALFGMRQGGDLSVQYVATGGLAALEPFSIEPVYLLGLTDAYRQVDPRLDWVGHWVTVPEDAFPEAVGTLALFREAQAQGLVDRDHPLLIVGWVDGQLTVRAVAAGEGRGEGREVSVVSGQELE
ncbi:hypothetical protein ACMT4L_19880 [Deinococcus sp. A31D244]|uniref:hypothetical protein n=1 Tax=Deinococcus sp. A31D244 TaxID=3397675 RepID=UPI0039E1D20D